MTPTRVNVPDVTASLLSGRSQVDEVKGRPKGATTTTSPGVRNALDALGQRARRELDGVLGTGDKTRSGIDRIADADRSAADRVRAVNTTPMPTPTPNGPTPMPQQTMMPQMAQQAAMAAQMAQQAAMAPMMAAQQASTMGSQYPQGTVFLTANQMSQLAAALNTPEGRSNPLAAVKQAWNGSTKPDPISVNEVAYEKTHGKLSEAQLDAAIEGAMDKTGIEPDARGKWKHVLKFMAHHESGYDASAVNLHDSNAIGPPQSDGAPAQSSRGAWQTIPTTFAAYHASGTSNNIYDPEASAGAAINHMMANHGAGRDGSGLDAFMAKRSGGYVGY